jgi:hypothetical protein
MKPSKAKRILLTLTNKRSKLLPLSLKLLHIRLPAR